MAPARRAGGRPKGPKGDLGRPQNAEAAWYGHPRHTPSAPGISAPPPTSGGGRGAHGVRRTTYLNVPVPLPFATTPLVQLMCTGKHKSEDARSAM